MHKMSRQNSIRISNFKTKVGQRLKMKFLISKRQIWKFKKFEQEVKKVVQKSL